MTGISTLSLPLMKTIQDETWLYAGVSGERLNLIRSGQIDLHDAFAEPEAKSLVQVTVPYDDHAPLRAVYIQPSQVPEDMLPEPGERLNLIASLPV